MNSTSPVLWEPGRATARATRHLRIASPGAARTPPSIPDHHPNAKFTRGSWWLITAISAFGDESEYPVVQALVSAAVCTLSRAGSARRASGFNFRRVSAPGEN